MIKNFYLCVLVLFLFSCSKGDVTDLFNQKNQTITVSAFTYMPYITTDVIFQDINLGVGNGALNVGMDLSPGQFSVEWSDAETGTKFTSSNIIEIPESYNKQFLIIHIYPNRTVEAFFSDTYPKESPKGLHYLKKQ